jgi:hypothetical protein
MLGGRQGVRSYVVGLTPDSPSTLQHRGSSCVPPSSSSPLGEAAWYAQPCSWDSGFFPVLPNPNLDVVRGALVWGPGESPAPSSPSVSASTPSSAPGELYQDSRWADDTRVRLEDNVGFTGLLSGLLYHGVDTEYCYLGHGLWQRYNPHPDDI